MKRFLLLLIMFPAVSFAYESTLDAFVKEQYPGCSYRLKYRRIRWQWRSLVQNKVGEEFQQRGLQWSPLWKGGELVGYLVVDTAKGKNGSFTLAVTYDTEQHITAIDILHNSSPHDLKLRQIDFIRQFYGHNMENTYVIGTDIDGISGSTYSVKGLSRAVWRINLVLPLIIGD